jgi:prepilin-type N-terminal cleavage/methylation domain-containing protein
LKTLKSGFTLIELLVVIAIIAILAAILFPVFAQAKESAKNSALLSNTKQIGLANIMYMADYDDSFPLIWQDSDPSGEGLWSWQGSVQSYMKNWGILTTPKATPPSGERAYWQRLQYFAGLPRIEAINTADTVFTTNLGAVTGGQSVQSMGIFGGGGGYGLRPEGVGGVTQSGIENISDNVMISEAGSWDYLVGVYGSSNPFTFCGGDGVWGPVWSAFAGKNVYAGPTTLTRPKNGRNGVATDCLIPDGMTTYVATDGSAKAVDFRGRILERVQRSDGTWVFKRFWSAGY